MFKCLATVFFVWFKMDSPYPLSPEFLFLRKLTLAFWMLQLLLLKKKNGIEINFSIMASQIITVSILLISPHRPIDQKSSQGSSGLSVPFPHRTKSTCWLELGSRLRLDVLCQVVGSIQFLSVVELMATCLQVQGQQGSVSCWVSPLLRSHRIISWVTKSRTQLNWTG